MSRDSWDHRLVCAACGHFGRLGGGKPWEGTRSERPTRGRLRLWLRTACHGKVLFAYNGRHLADLADCVAATDRGRGIGWPRGMATKSMIAMLPRWIVAGKNRDDVLRGVARLRAKLGRVR